MIVAAALLLAAQPAITLNGTPGQGAAMTGQVPPGTTLTLNGQPVILLGLEGAAKLLDWYMKRR